jgi:Putative lactococcus lactis phage r1t holin
MNKKYMLDLLERVGFTFVQAFLAVLIAANSIEDLNITLVQSAWAAGVAAVLALVKGLVAKPVGDKDSAGFTS